MSLLKELNTIISPLISIETGTFKKKAPDRYVILTPLADTYECHADNKPEYEIEEVRISLYDKGNYTQLKHDIAKSLIDEEITITNRRYVGYENETGYHHYVIDTAKEYKVEEIENVKEEE